MTTTAVAARGRHRSRTASVDAVVVTIEADRRRVRRRAIGVGVTIAVALLAGSGAEILVGGSADIAVGEIPAALVGHADGLSHFVIFETRLPRALTALLSGALFGLAGVIYQRLISNVLATPDIIGVSAGASAGAVAVLVGIGLRGLALQLGAIVGASAAALIIFALSWRRGSSTYRLVLVGIGIGACFSAVTSYLLTFADGSISSRAMRWLIGSLSGADWDGVVVLAAATVLGGAGALLLEPSLSTIQLGDDLAAALGTRVQVVRMAALLLGAVLAAIATSITGPVAFVALVSGPIAGRLLPRSGPLPAAAVGASVVVVADLVAQTGPGISPVPTGVITGLIGAPVLMVLLINQKADTR
ncbi:MAG: FecCD family ABC transporter permease [Acidimicrobiales bacterium]